MSLAILGAADAPRVTALLAEAFSDYPAMRFVLGSTPRYAEQLERLIGFFVAARVLREDLMLGVAGADGRLVAAALVTLPVDRQPPDELALRREVLWRELGAEARARYEAFGTAAGQFAIAEPHHHLNMIGVLPAEIGKGHARILLEHVHHLAEVDPRSRGVTLTTEKPENLPLYLRFGYRQTGHARVSAILETWGFYRPG